jgi:hypothetical protein
MLYYLLPLNIPNFLKEKTATPEDDTLNKILKDCNKPDPDYFKGLRTFLLKKIKIKNYLLKIK